MHRRTFLAGTLGAASAALLTESPLADAAAPAEAAAQAAKAAATVVVNAPAGRIRGLRIDGAQVFKGIPYGKPMLGAARFQPPTAMPRWSGERDAFAFGPRAPQPPRAMIPEVGDALVGSGATGEDCLTLNVWTTGRDGGPRGTRLKPVVVWFHGGAYRSGSANSIFYDGTALATRHDVVVVTVNHRLNVLGFLDLSAFGDERYARSGNAGLLDLVLALRWVRDNIAAFGGDPAVVTAMGQSGGGGKVSMLMGIPDAKGLFHRAIIMSTLVESGVKALTREQSRAATERLLQRLKIAPTNIAALHDVPVAQLMAAQLGPNGISTAQAPGTGDADDISTSFYPVVDGMTLPQHPFDPTAPALNATVAVLTGSDETEGIPYGDPGDPYWTSEIADDAALRTRVAAALRITAAEADTLVQTYHRAHPGASPADIGAILNGDLSGSRQSSRIIAERKSAEGRAPAFHYYFQWRSPVRNGKLRTMHSMELPFLWDHVEKFPEFTGTGADRAPLATAMSTAFMTFARTGVPAAPGLPAWTPFDATRRATMVFDRDSRLVDDPYGEVRQALDAIRARAGQRS